MAIKLISISNLYGTCHFGQEEIKLPLMIEFSLPTGLDDVLGDYFEGLIDQTKKTAQLIINKLILDDLLKIKKHHEILKKTQK